MKEIKDAHQTVNTKLLKTKEISDKTKSMETKLEAAETQDAVAGVAVAIDVKAVAEALESVTVDVEPALKEPESAVDVQELTELATDQLQSIEAESDEVVDAVGTAEDDRVEVKPVEMNSVETEDTGSPHTVVVEVVEPVAEDAVCPEINDEEAVAATAEKEATVEETTVSDDIKEDLSADAAANLESTEVVVENGSDSSDADNKGASTEGLAALATDEEPADERIPVDTCEEITSIVETDAMKAVAAEGDTETTTWEAVESEYLDEAEPVIQDMDLSVEGIATEPTVEQVVVKAVADFETDDEAVPVELEVNAEGDSKIAAEEVTKGEAAPVDVEVEEAIAVQEQEVAGKETEAFDIEADIAVESSVTTESTTDDDTPVNRIVGTIVKEVKAEEVDVVKNDEAAKKETETASIDEDAEVDMEETETDTAFFDEGTEVVMSAVEIVAVAPSAEIDEASVDETKTSNTEVAEVAVEETVTETVPVAETKEVQLEKSENVEAVAVENDLEKVEESDQSIDKMPSVATVQTASAIAKVSDDEVAPIEQMPALKIDSADGKPVEVNVTVSTVSEYEENESSKSSENFEVDTKPISAVSTLIGRFEHIAKRNAMEVASSRTSSRVSSPLSSPPLSCFRETVSKTVVKSNKAIESTEGPVHVKSNNEDVLTEAEADQEVSEVETSAKVAESVDVCFGFEETTAEIDICEKAATLNETVAHENALAATDVDGAAKVVEATFVAVDDEESTLEVEACNEKFDAFDEASVAEVGVVEQELIDESSEAEVEVAKTLAVEIEQAEIIAEPEIEDVGLESSTKEEISKTAEEADAIALEAIKTDGAVEEVPVDMAEADYAASEPQTILAAYKPVEASILFVDAPEVDVAWNEAVGGVLEDAAPSVTSVIDMEEAVATSDFTTEETMDNFMPVTKQIEEHSSDFVSAMKETQAMYEELTESQVEGGKQEEMTQSMEKEMILTSPPAPGVQIDGGALAYEVTTKASVVTAPSNEVMKAVNDDATRTEGTPERDSLQIPYEQLTYEILGVTRANNVIMYHIYAINNATDEQAMSIPKRYSEFKLLDEQLRALDLPSALSLPMLPKPGVVSFLRGRRSQKTIEMREKAFGDFLHYVRDHEDLHRSTVFQRFIAN
ncbi:unnamed protein product [Peronospora destructor]|uniref:PX domain-containing protein n=1 Tax=Peronospora destructor TaxID=86335 RepID=A0AAV0T0P8_9STRA|nr:unnamed protein product [Peronospora destructor]